MAHDLDRLTREQLEERRNALHVELAAVNDRLQAHARARRTELRADFDAWQADECRNLAGSSLDPST